MITNCSCCGRDRDCEIFAVRDFPASDSWCQECSNNDAQPFWLIRFKNAVFQSSKHPDNAWTEDAIIFWKGEYVTFSTVSDTIHNITNTIGWSEYKKLPENKDRKSF